MQVDTRELMFIKQNAPRGMTRLVADRLGISTIKVINELRLVKDNYNDAIILETRRLLKDIKGVSFNPKSK